MRVPEVVLNCVGYVGEVAQVNNGVPSGDLYATGFFVSVPVEAEELSGHRFIYFVTAKHVATDLRDREIFFLVNRKGGGITYIREVAEPIWCGHPDDKTADVALIQVMPQGDADIQTIGIEQFGTPEKLKALAIGIGDEVYATGLFTPVPGTTKNMPIVRHGNIAMMPEEQIQTELGYADVYLVEARSIGGLSGSPVFVRPTLNIPIPPFGTEKITNMYALGHGATLLGLMHGHWDIKESDLNKADIVQNRKHGVNLGIGIVVPAIKILEAINSDYLVERRMKTERTLLKKVVPGMDSAKRKEEPQFTQADFQDALKKASRKVEQ